jgi:hypothetical protein
LTERVRASTAVNAPKRRVRALISRTLSLIRRPISPGGPPQSRVPTIGIPVTYAASGRPG